MVKPTLKVGAGKSPPSARTISQKIAPVPGGRPVSNVGRYLFRPTDNDTSGGEIINATPDAIRSVNENFLKKGQLPPALQPKYLRKPEVMQQATNKKISKGFNNQRSRQG